MSNSNALEQLEKELILLNKELKEKDKVYQLQRKELLQAKIKAETSEQMMHTLVETAVGSIGQDFFDNIVIKLSSWLNVDCVLIGQMLEPNRISCLPLYLDGKISHDFSYELSGSPCDITTRKGYCCYTENVINEFPRDKILVDLGAEGYIGTALYNSDGIANGVICAVSRKKFDIPPFAERMLKIIGDRVSVEIERKKAEEALRKSENELRESNATKDKFLSIIAHDLKSPFNSILGFSELMIANFSDYSDEKKLKCISHIHDAAQNTYVLLENLLTWSLAKQGLITISLSKINIEELITLIITFTNSLAKSKQIEIKVDVDKNIFVQSDKNLLSVIIRNLISNAIKYSNSGDTIIVSGYKKNSSSVEICVSDNGIGIEPENLSKLFHLDKSFSTPGTKNEKGTGLGLILCKEFAEKLGGLIHAESEPSNGSKFILTLNKV